MRNFSNLFLLSIILTQFAFAGRYYDARVGRFLQIDPNKEKYHALSPYCYVANNPLNATDPDGKDIKMIYREPNVDAGHIILQVVDHATGKVMATWSFGPKSSGAALTLTNVEGHQTADINAYLKDNKDRLQEATIGTDQQTDKTVSKNIGERKNDNEEYNLLDNNCGQTAVQLINTSGIVTVQTNSVLPSSVFKDFLDAKKQVEEQKKQEAQKKKEGEKKKEQEKQQGTNGSN